MAGRMSASHLAPQGGGFEPQRKHNFEVQLFGVPGQDIIKLVVESFQPPEPNNDPIELPHMNNVVKVAGQGKFSDSEMTVKDMVDAPVFASLLQWKKMVQDPDTDSIGFASSYKKQGRVVLIAPDGSVERAYKIKGVWPKTVRGDQLAHNSPGYYIINVTLIIDSAVPEF